jgi:hypothetical protein
MSRHSIRIAALIGMVLVVCAFAPAPATAQEGNALLLQTGTTLVPTRNVERLVAVADTAQRLIRSPPP